MSTPDLPFRATIVEACAWLAAQTGTPWTLARLLEHELTPYVWLDYDPAYPELFGDANGGYAAPIFYAADIARLAGGSEDVLITRTKDAYKIIAVLPEPGFTRALADLRFLKRDVEKLAGRLKHAASTPGGVGEGTTAWTRESTLQEPPKQAAKESQLGITRAEVLAAFGPVVRMNLEKALDDAIGIFGDDGARVKASVRKSKRNAVWNPVTLALGLHDVYRAPLGALKRAFKTHDCLLDWEANWEQSLRLLGK
ncbi:hypothetical protein [Massilia brevitalea]|uniref:hypothetical protein n=1 Tax=Massilia brevitalea TaxID=442526 RepID=UPI0027388665|nr:hypothetical protein [Massilia brevitalea]